jgi:hypothetical protein
MTNLKVKQSDHHTYTVVDDFGDNRTGQVFPTVHMEISQQSGLSDHLYAFERFLQAIGFVLPENSHLDFVSESSDEEDQDSYEE